MPVRVVGDVFQDKPALAINSMNALNSPPPRRDNDQLGRKMTIVTGRQHRPKHSPEWSWSRCRRCIDVQQRELRRSCETSRQLFSEETLGSGARCRATAAICVDAERRHDWRRASRHSGSPTKESKPTRLRTVRARPGVESSRPVDADRECRQSCVDLRSMARCREARLLSSGVARCLYSRRSCPWWLRESAIRSMVQDEID